MWTDRFLRVQLGTGVAGCAQRGSHAASVLASLALSGCVDSVAPASGVRIAAAAVSPSANSVVAAVVTFAVRGGDSVRVRYGTGGQLTAATPFAVSRGPADTIVILGLSAGTTYQFLAEALNAGTVARSDTMALTTGPLPSDLATITLDVATGPSPAPPYLLTDLAVGSRTYLIAFDRAGTIRWYRRFDVVTTGGSEVKQQPNDNVTAFLGLSQGFQPTYGYYVEVTPAGDVVRTYSAPPPYYTDDHELLLSGSHGGVDAVHMLAYDIRQTDLVSLGGPPNAFLAGHTLLRLSPSGSVRFFWSSWDHITLADWIEPTGVSANTDFDHMNSLDLDADGGYVVSLRNEGEVMKIDSSTGAYAWRLGGRNSQFAIVGDPLGGFSGQHSVRVVPGGHILMFDNGLRHNPPESRAVEYELDFTARTATMIWQFRHTPTLYSPTRGSVTRLLNGHTLVAFGVTGVTTEVDAQGNVVWEATLRASGQPAAFYRMTPISSLYEYRKP
jgi:outer membrane protein assembly factor BamB